MVMREEDDACKVTMVLVLRHVVVVKSGEGLLSVAGFVNSTSTRDLFVQRPHAPSQGHITTIPANSAQKHRMDILHA